MFYSFLHNQSPVSGNVRLGVESPQQMMSQNSSATTTTVLDWAQNRSFPFADVKLGSLATAWRDSRRRISRLQAVFQRQPLPHDVATIAVSGSLSRMEAHAKSDLDLLVVLDDRQANVSADEQRDAYNEIWRRLTEAFTDEHIHPPKPCGVFSCCASGRRLTDLTVRGIVDEDVTTYGQRMQLLLDAQPVVNHERFEELQCEILNWYAETHVAKQFNEAGVFHWLWQDVQRYWRSIRARATWLHEGKPLKSAEVNLKLRSSRMVLVTAFLYAIEKAHARAADVPSSITELQRQLRATPVERIGSVLTRDEIYAEFLCNYQYIWERVRCLSDATAEVTDDDREVLSSMHSLIAGAAVGQLPDWIV